MNFNEILVQRQIYRCVSPEARLGIDDGTKSAVQLKNESKLRSWLENKTLGQILQWFDAVYAIQVETPYGKRCQA